MAVAERALFREMDKLVGAASYKVIVDVLYC
jgi:hypothetical protein